MSVRTPRYPKEEFTRRGEEIYDRDIGPLVESNYKGKVVAIDIETADYELGDNVLVTSKALQARNPDAQIWVVRIGHRAVHRIGRCSNPEAGSVFIMAFGLLGVSGLVRQQRSYR